MNSFQTVFWKLLTVSGVVAAGCFVALQVQSQLGDLANEAQAATASELDPTGVSDPFAETLAPATPLNNPNDHANPSGGPVSEGHDPFQANVPELASDFASEQPVDGNMISATMGDEHLLAQADAGLNPFDFGPESAPAPKPIIAPRPLVIPAGETPKPIGRVELGDLNPAIDQAAQNLEQLRLNAQQAAQQFGDQIPAVIPRGGVQPIPTTIPTNGPVVRPAAGEPIDLAQAPDPFSLDLPPVEQPAASPSPAPTPAADPNPFALDLTPVEQPPVRSASAPSAGDLLPLPSEGLPARSLDSVPMPQDATLSVAEPPAPGGDDFLGDGVIDRDVPRGVVRPELTLNKVAPSRASIGKPLVYEIQLANVGDAVAKNVVVEDQIPRGAKLLGTKPQAEMPEGSKKLIWRFASLNPGDTKLLQIQVEPISAGQIGSIATVRFVAEAAAETKIAAPDLKFQLFGPDEAVIGEEANYRFEISNAGDEDARDVKIRCLVPAGLQSPSGDPDLEYPVGVVKAGESKTVPLPLAAIGTGDYTTSAMLESSASSPRQSDLPIRIIKSRLALDRQGPGKRFVGSKVQFTNLVTNNSSRALRNVTITETLPANVQFITADAGGRQAAPGNVVWTLAELAPGETRNINVTFQPQSAGEKQSTVQAISDDGSKTAIRAKMAVIGFAALKVEAERDNRPFSIGEQVSVRLNIKNGGSAAARAVETSITLPSELNLVKANGPVQYTQVGNVLRFQPLASIEDGKDVSIVLTFDTVHAGDARIGVQLQSNDLDAPLNFEESIRVINIE